MCLEDLEIEDMYELVVDSVDHTGVMPEAYLMCAVLWRAFMDLDSTGSTRREAEYWLEVRYNDPIPVYSYQWICQHLSLCPDGLYAEFNTKEKRGRLRHY